MMSHFEEMLGQYDAETARLLSVQCLGPDQEFSGAFIMPGCHADTRSSGFGAAHLAVSYLLPSSRYYLSAEVRSGLEKAF